MRRDAYDWANRMDDIRKTCDHFRRPGIAYTDLAVFHFQRTYYHIPRSVYNYVARAGREYLSVKLLEDTLAVTV